MKAFIFAAGRGERLGELTKDKPKCLLDVGGVPILGLWINALLDLGVSEIGINTHCHADMVRHFLVERYSAEMTTHRIFVHMEPELLGSAGTLKAVANRYAPSDTVLLVYCDVWTSFSAVVGKLIARHESMRSQATIGIHETGTPCECGVVEVDGDYVRDIIEKPRHPNTNTVWSGLAVVHQSVLQTIGDLTETQNDIARDWLPLLVEKRIPIMTYAIQERLIDIGGRTSYVEAYDLALKAAK